MTKWREFWFGELASVAQTYTAEPVEEGDTELNIDWNDAAVWKIWREESWLSLYWCEYFYRVDSTTRTVFAGFQLRPRPPDIAHLRPVEAIMADSSWIENNIKKGDVIQVQLLIKDECNMRSSAWKAFVVTDIARADKRKRAGKVPPGCITLNTVTRAPLIGEEFEPKTEHSFVVKDGWLRADWEFDRFYGGLRKVTTQEAEILKKVDSLLLSQYEFVLENGDPNLNYLLEDIKEVDRFWIPDIAEPEPVLLAPRNAPVVPQAAAAVAPPIHAVPRAHPPPIQAVPRAQHERLATTDSPASHRRLARRAMARVMRQRATGDAVARDGGELGRARDDGEELRRRGRHE